MPPGTITITDRATGKKIRVPWDKPGLPTPEEAERLIRAAGLVQSGKKKRPKAPAAPPAEQDSWSYDQRKTNLRLTPFKAGDYTPKPPVDGPSMTERLGKALHDSDIGYLARAAVPKLKKRPDGKFGLDVNPFDEPRDAFGAPPPGTKTRREALPPEERKLVDPKKKRDRRLLPAVMDLPNLPQGNAAYIARADRELEAAEKLEQAYHADITEVDGKTYSRKDAAAAYQSKIDAHRRQAEALLRRAGMRDLGSMFEEYDPEYGTTSADRKAIGPRPTSAASARSMLKEKLDPFYLAQNALDKGYTGLTKIGGAAAAAIAPPLGTRVADRPHQRNEHGELMPETIGEAVATYLANTVMPVPFVDSAIAKAAGNAAWKTGEKAAAKSIAEYRAGLLDVAMMAARTPQERNAARGLVSKAFDEAVVLAEDSVSRVKGMHPGQLDQADVLESFQRVGVPHVLGKLGIPVETGARLGLRLDHPIPYNRFIPKAAKGYRSGEAPNLVQMAERRKFVPTEAAAYDEGEALDLVGMAGGRPKQDDLLPFERELERELATPQEPREFEPWNPFENDPALRARPTGQDDLVPFYHFSTKDEPFTTLDPAQQGTGFQGAQDKPVEGAQYSNVYLDGKAEGVIVRGGKRFYSGSIPRNRLYDIKADDLGLFQDLYRTDQPAFNAALRSHGYLGYYNPGHESLGNVARLIDPTPVAEHPFPTHMLGRDADRTLSLPKTRRAPTPEEMTGFEDGGTWDLDENVFVSDGYMVANERDNRMLGRVQELPGRVSPEAISAYADLHGVRHVGWWFDPEREVTILEPSTVVKRTPGEGVDPMAARKADLDDAITVARMRGEAAIWDGYNFRSIYTKLDRSPVEATVKTQDAYIAKSEGLGIPTASGPLDLKIKGDDDLSRRIADFYEEATHDPDNPRVLAAYTKFADETMAQWEAIMEEHPDFKAVPWAGAGEPYPDSSAMMNDIRNENRMYFYKTIGDEEGVGGFGTGEQDLNNPMLRKPGIVLEDSAGKPYEMTVNDVFRVVHDYFAHATTGNQFGPLGELRAWLEHYRMFSREAGRAMSSETLAQNSWVNYGPHLRDAETDLIPGPGQPGYVPISQRPFADQKNILLPDELIDEYAAKAGFDMPAPKPAAKKGRKKAAKAEEVEVDNGPEPGLPVKEPGREINFKGIDRKFFDSRHEWVYNQWVRDQRTANAARYKKTTPALTKAERIAIDLEEAQAKREAYTWQEEFWAENDALIRDRDRAIAGEPNLDVQQRYAVAKEEDIEAARERLFNQKQKGGTNLPFGDLVQLYDDVTLLMAKGIHYGATFLEWIEDMASKVGEWIRDGAENLWNEVGDALFPKGGFDRAPGHLQRGAVGDLSKPRSAWLRRPEVQEFMDGAHPKMYEDDGVTPRVFVHATGSTDIQEFDPDRGTLMGHVAAWVTDDVDFTNAWGGTAHYPLIVAAKKPFIPWADAEGLDLLAQEMISRKHDFVNAVRNFDDVEPSDFGLTKTDRNIVAFLEDSGELYRKTRNHLAGYGNKTHREVFDEVLRFMEDNRDLIDNQNIKFVDMVRPTIDKEAAILVKDLSEWAKTYYKTSPLFTGYPAPHDPSMMLNYISDDWFDFGTHDPAAFQWRDELTPEQNVRDILDVIDNIADNIARTYSSNIINGTIMMGHGHHPLETYKGNAGSDLAWDDVNPLDIEDSAIVEWVRNNMIEGDWERIERPEFVEAIKGLGYDAIFMTEGGANTLAILDPTLIKSVFNPKPTSGNRLIMGAVNPGARRRKPVAEPKPVEPRPLPTSADIQAGIVDMPEQGKSNLEVALWLENYARNLLGGRPLRLKDPKRPRSGGLTDIEAEDALTEAMKAETVMGMATGGRGHGFYNAETIRIHEGLQVLTKHFLGREATAEELELYHLIGSIHSPRTKPSPEAFDSVAVWIDSIEQGRIDMTRLSGGATRKEGLGRLSKEIEEARDTTIDLLESFNGSWQELKQWLMELHPIEDLRARKPKIVKGELEAVDGQYYGSLIFGPKVGAYWLNRIGLDLSTKDVWAHRTVNRLAGTLVQPKMTRVRNPKTGKKEWKRLLNDARILGTGGVRETAIVNNAFRRSADELGLDVREVQEILWQREKDLWMHLGADVDNTTYSEGIEAVLAQLGLELPPLAPDSPVMLAREQNAMKRTRVIESLNASGELDRLYPPLADVLATSGRDSQEYIKALQRVLSGEVDNFGRATDATMKIKTKTKLLDKVPAALRNQTGFVRLPVPERTAPTVLSKDQFEAAIELALVAVRQGARSKRELKRLMRPLVGDDAVWAVVNQHMDTVYHYTVNVAPIAEAAKPGGRFRSTTQIQDLKRMRGGTLKQVGFKGFLRSWLATDREALGTARRMMETARGLERDTLSYSPHDLERQIAQQTKIGGVVRDIVENGFLDGQGGRKSLGLPAFKELLGDDLDAWVEYRRRVRENELYDRGAISDEDFVENHLRASELEEAAEGRFADYDAEWDRLAMAQLELYEELGIRKPGWAAAIRGENPKYFPMHSDDSVQQAALRDMGVLATQKASQEVQVKRAVGGSVYVDPFAAFGATTEAVIRAGELSKAVLPFFRDAAEIPELAFVARELSTERTVNAGLPDDAELDELLEMFDGRSKVEGDDAIVTIYDNGAKRQFAVDAAIWEAIRAIAPQDYSAAGAMVRVWAGFVRGATTKYNPAFAFIFNPMLDYYSAAVNKGINLADWTSALKEAWMQGADYQEAVHAKVFFESRGARDLIQQDWIYKPKQHLVSRIADDVAQKLYGVRYIGPTLKSYGRAAQAIEETTRLAVYRKRKFQLVNEGMGATDAELRASMESAETMNFGEAGLIGRFLGNIGVPFANVPSQSAVASWRGMKNRGPKWLLRGMLSISAWKLAEAITYEGDPYYDSLPEYVKDTSLLIKAPNGEFYAWRLPADMGMIFGGIPRRAVQAVLGGEDAGAADLIRSEMAGLADSLKPPFLAPYATTALTAGFYAADGRVLDPRWFRAGYAQRTSDSEEEIGQDRYTMAKTIASQAGGALTELGVKSLGYILGYEKKFPNPVQRFNPKPDSRKLRDKWGIED